jgi:hypothetical protein
MSRFAIRLLSIVLVPVNADAQSKVLADEVEQLLRIHESEGMEVTNFLAVGNARDLVNPAVVSSLHLVRIFNDLVDEVTDTRCPENLGGSSRHVQPVQAHRLLKVT